MSDKRRVAPRGLPWILRPGILGLGFLIGLQGCVSGGSRNPFSDSQNAQWYSIRVENRNLYEVSVYVVPRSRRQLVGTVSPSRYQFLEFEYPRGLPLSVELENEIGDRYRIPSFTVVGGGRLDLIVYENIRRSGFVRRR